MAELQNSIDDTQDVKFAVELSPDAMFRIASNGRIVYANRAAHRLLGFRPRELERLEIFDITSLTTRRQWPERCRHLRIVGARVFETNFLTRQGHAVPVDLAVSHQTYDGEDFAEIVARDISARRALEARVLEIQDTERRRIGQDLHDDIGQRLTAIALGLENLSHDLLDCGRDTRDVLELAAYTRETLNHVRNLSAGLLPIPNDINALKAAIEQLARAVRDTTTLECDWRSARHVSLTGQFVVSNVYRIVQEAVTNAVRHGRATRVVVHCAAEAGRLTLQIEDNGTGFDQSSQPGLGLRIMDYRARSIGAQLDVEAAEAGGVAVRLTLPTAQTGAASLDP